MNKSAALFILLTLIISGVNAQNLKALNLSGTVKNVNGGKIYLQKFNDKNFDTVDSTVIQNGKFEFKSAVQLPELYGLTLDKNKNPFYIFLEDSPIVVTLDATNNYRNSKVTGSKSQTRFERFQKQQEEINISDFIKEDPSSMVSAYVFYRNYSYRLSPQEIRDNIALLNETLHKTQYVKVLEQLANTVDKVLPGNKAPDFVSTTPEGKTERFSDHFGKGYILLDFWAAWCGPCRRENPNLVAAYQKYKEKGFAIYGVSLDKSKASWIKAIENDKLTWTQVSDLKFWNSEAAALYGVRAIPSNFLINADGEIVARNVTGEDLQKLLQELLGEEN